MTKQQQLYHYLHHPSGVYFLIALLAISTIGVVWSYTTAQYEWMSMGIHLVTISILGYTIWQLSKRHQSIHSDLEKLEAFLDSPNHISPPSFFDNRFALAVENIASKDTYISLVSERILLLGEGDLNVKFPEEAYNNSTLSHALATMRNKLKASALKEEKSKWELTQKGKLSNILEEEHSPNSLAEATCIWLQHALEISHIAIWVISNANGSNAQYELLYLNGYKGIEVGMSQYPISDPIIQQLQKSSAPKMLFNKTIHASYIAEQGEESKQKGRLHFMVLPLAMNKKLYGFIELGNNARFSAEQMKFPRIIAEKICTGFMRIKSQEHTHYLLNESQMLAEELQQREENLQALNQSIQKQHNKVAESINYASHIQDAIIPHQSKLRQLFPKSFLLNAPRDKVSGDFAWLHSHKDAHFIAAADCTGHGVPGAMLSMMGFFLLESLIDKLADQHPALTLEKLDEQLMALLSKEQSSFGQQISIDIILCKIYPESHVIELASAYRPLYIHDGESLQVIKGDRKTIGGGKKHIKAKMAEQFTAHTLSLAPNTALYLFSDGYVDQFGGSRNMKMGSKRLQQFINQSHMHEMEQQEQLFHDFFHDWRGVTPQIDDMLFIGIKL